jgi:hypothetical protein
MNVGGDGICAPRAVPEGGTIEVEVTNGAAEIEVYVGAERDAVLVKVVGGKASVPVPPRATNGMLITILTSGTPPASTAVEVVSQQA